MKKTHPISLLLGPILGVVLACGGSGESDTIERDVYQTKEECRKDWETQELCERMNDQDERQYQDSHGVHYPVYWGPHYYGRDRTVIYQGRTITPTTRSSSIPSYRVTSSSSSASRTGVSSPRSSTTSTGGLGSHGSSGTGS